MILTLTAFSYYYNFYCNINCNVGSHKKKKKADVLKLTCHYLTLAVHLIERPDDGLINPKHVACTSERKYMLCLTENLTFFFFSKRVQASLGSWQ
jgi:hypothetical protein